MFTSGITSEPTDVIEPNDPDREDRNFFLRLFSLGLSPKPPGIMPKTQWPSVGMFHTRVLPEEFEPSPPFEPIDRLQPGDLYWIAKRIAAVPVSTIAQALEVRLEFGPRGVRGRGKRRRSHLRIGVNWSRCGN